jgi:hypothetical protein
MTGAPVSNAFLNFLASLKTQAEAALTVPSDAQAFSAYLDDDARRKRRRRMFDDSSFSGRLTSNGIGSLEVGGALDWPSPQAVDYGNTHGLT